MIAIATTGVYDTSFERPCHIVHQYHCFNLRQSTQVYKWHFLFFLDNFLQPPLKGFKHWNCSKQRWKLRIFEMDSCWSTLGSKFDKKLVFRPSAHGGACFHFAVFFAQLCTTNLGTTHSASATLSSSPLPSAIMAYSTKETVPNIPGIQEKHFSWAKCS